MKKTFPGGVHPLEHKEFSKDAAPVVYLPKGEMVYPLGQHIGKPAKAVVGKGDKVLVGQLIGEADGFVSANIVSGCSGTVKAVENRRVADGSSKLCVVINNDGLFTEIEGINQNRDYKKMTKDEIIGAVKAAGIVGMGGAGFPVNVKLMPKNPDAIKYVIANGAECEPFITCDDRLMRDHAEEIVTAVEILVSLYPNAEGVILVEDNKPEAIQAMKAAVAKSDKVTLVTPPTKYPQGGERSIIKLVAEADLKLGMLPADVGCIVQNVASLYAIYNAVVKNRPLFERSVTVSGDAIAKPSNFITRIGVSVRELVEEAGGFKDGAAPQKVLSGGPMMGIPMPSLDVPVQKANNAVTLLKVDEVKAAEEIQTACIRCGRCTRVCSLGLNPQLMATAAEKKDFERYEKKLYGLECIACGCCTFICPAKRPLMQLFKTTKAEIMATKRR